MKVNIIVKRLFDSHYGNTYHRVMIVDRGHVIVSETRYGYGSQYLVTAHELLVEECVAHPDYMTWARSADVNVLEIDVTRKRDLVFTDCEISFYSRLTEGV